MSLRFFVHPAYDTRSYELSDSGRVVGRFKEAKWADGVAEILNECGGDIEAAAVLAEASNDYKINSEELRLILDAIAGNSISFMAAAIDKRLTFAHKAEITLNAVLEEITLLAMGNIPEDKDFDEWEGGCRKLGILGANRLRRNQAKLIELIKSINEILPPDEEDKTIGADGRDPDVPAGKKKAE